MYWRCRSKMVVFEVRQIDEFFNHFASSILFHFGICLQFVNYYREFPNCLIWQCDDDSCNWRKWLQKTIQLSERIAISLDLYFIVTRFKYKILALQLKWMIWLPLVLLIFAWFLHFCIRTTSPFFMGVRTLIWYDLNFLLRRYLIQILVQLRCCMFPIFAMFFLNYFSMTKHKFWM